MKQDITNIIFNFFKKKIKKNKKIALHEPIFDDIDYKYLKECLDSSFVSSKGKFTELFESKLKEYTKSKYVIAVINGTAGLEMALRGANVKTNEEVIVPALTFVATANAVSHCGAIPHFVDSSLDDFGIDVSKLNTYLINNTKFTKNGIKNKKTGRKISAIVPVHCFGHAMKIDNLLKLAKKFKLKVIEDATESLGSFYKKKHLGTYGDLGVLSFNGNKIITCGGGGAILTNNKNIYKKIMHLVTTARIKNKYQYSHDKIAWNFRLPSINAALGLSQLSKIKEYIKYKRKLAKQYEKYFRKFCKKIKFIKEPVNSYSNYWLNTIFIKNTSKKSNNYIVNYLNRNNVECRLAWKLISKLEMYKNSPRSNLKNAELLEKSLINLPSSYFLAK